MNVSPYSFFCLYGSSVNETEAETAKAEAEEEGS